MWNLVLLKKEKWWKSAKKICSIWKPVVQNVLLSTSRFLWMSTFDPRYLQIQKASVRFCYSDFCRGLIYFWDNFSVIMTFLAKKLHNHKPKLKFEEWNSSRSTDNRNLGNDLVHLLLQSSISHSRTQILHRVSFQTTSHWLEHVAFWSNQESIHQ